MKLTEKQAFKVMDIIEKYYWDNYEIELNPEEKADFVMLNLINKELGED